MRFTVRLTIAVVAFGAAQGCRTFGDDSKIDQARVDVLASDPLALATPPDTTPDIRQVVAANQGIGETTAGSVLVTRHLSGSPVAALKALGITALDSGWLVYSVNCAPTIDGFVGEKQFSGWVASAVVNTRSNDVLSIYITTEYHQGAPRTLGPPSTDPITLSTLSRTCLR